MGATQQFQHKMVQPALLLPEKQLLLWPHVAEVAAEGAAGAVAAGLPAQQPTAWKAPARGTTKMKRRMQAAQAHQEVVDGAGAGGAVGAEVRLF